jgi:hypothetical protein
MFNSESARILVDNTLAPRKTQLIIQKIPTHSPDNVVEVLDSLVGCDLRNIYTSEKSVSEN